MNPIARRTDVIVQEVGPDVVVYDQLTDTAHSLNGVAGFVYRNADGTRSVQEISARLSAELALADGPELTEAALWQLEQANLLVPTDGSTARRISRREAMVRFGATALSLAAVTSLVAPTPAMARSGHSLHPRGAKPYKAPKAKAPKKTPKAKAPSTPGPTTKGPSSKGGGGKGG